MLVIELVADLADSIADQSIEDKESMAIGLPGKTISFRRPVRGAQGAGHS